MIPSPSDASDVERIEQQGADWIARHYAGLSAAERVSLKIGKRWTRVTRRSLQNSRRRGLRWIGWARRVKKRVALMRISSRLEACVRAGAWHRRWQPQS